MKKAIGLIASLILVITLGIYVYNNIIAPSFRYASPVESFEKSGPRKSELVDVLEDKDIALLIYKGADGVFSDKIIAKDARGWTSMSVSSRNKRLLSQSNGFVYLKKVQGKSVIMIVRAPENDIAIPVVSDSLNSTFLSSLQNHDSGGKVIYELLVFEGSLPDDYKLYIGEQEITGF